MAAQLYYFVTQLPEKLCEADKKLHIAWSFWLMLASCVLWPTPWAFAAVFLLGLAKECWDSRFGSGFCFFDLASNLLGCAFALILVGMLPGPFFD